MAKLPPFNTYWVIPNQFMAGEYPGYDYDQSHSERRLDALIEAGITSFIDLTEPNERVPYDLLVKNALATIRLKSAISVSPSETLAYPAKTICAPF